MYLVQFTYDHYCQGWEDATIQVLVKNVSCFKDACEKISLHYHRARDFENLTIE